MKSYLFTDAKLSDYRKIYRDYLTQALAIESVRTEGLSWYQKAHDCCTQMADAAGIDRDVMYRVVAVLSPRVSWSRNLVMAQELAESRATTGIYTNIRKALQMIEQPSLFLLREDTGPKTYCFYECIARPTTSQRAVIDRQHMTRILDIPFKTSISFRNYCLLEAIIQDLAREFNILPMQAQALIWVLAKLDTNRWMNLEAV